MPTTDHRTVLLQTDPSEDQRESLQAICEDVLNLAAHESGTGWVVCCNNLTHG